MIEKDTDNLTRRIGLDGYAAQQVENMLVRWADDMTPMNGRSLYSEAGAQWAGPSAMVDAMEYGRAALRERAEVTAQRVSRMARSEQDAFLFGVLDAAQEKLGSMKITNDACGAIGMTANPRRAIQAAMSAVTDDPAMQR
jgi:hypothetical protein